MGRYTVCISLLVCMIQCGGGDRADDIMLESELALRAMLAQVTPLMELLQTPHRIIAKRSADGETAEAVEAGAEPEGRAIRRRPGLQQHLQDRPSDRYGNGYNDGFGEYASASGSYGYGGGGGYQSYGCCNQKKDELLPILALVALSLLLLYLIALATTTTAAAGGGGRRRRDIEMLDAPSWMSMVSEMWQQYEDPNDELACALRTLCRMNQIANETPGQAGWAVSLTSLPLSYLLHHRRQSGFTNYMAASVMGWNGANCTQLYSQCPRLAYY